MLYGYEAVASTASRSFDDLYLNTLKLLPALLNTSLLPFTVTILPVELFTPARRFECSVLIFSANNCVHLLWALFAEKLVTSSVLRFGFYHLNQKHVLLPDH